jgi:hypothetical protein
LIEISFVSVPSWIVKTTSVKSFVVLTFVDAFVVAYAIGEEFP